MIVVSYVAGVTMSPPGRAAPVENLLYKGESSIVRDTFRGGVHPAGRKELSRDAGLREFLPKGEMVYPLSQHIGKPAKPIVKKGDAVLVGQRIAEADGFVSANITCSCSGTVKGIEKRRTLMGAMADCIVVDNDGQFNQVEGIGQKQDISDLTNGDLLFRVQNAGIVGLGGAGFPTHVKLAPKNPMGIRYVIANGAECEPYLTCNDQLMRTRADAIVEGLELVLRLFPNAEGVSRQRMRVLPMKTKYPQGGERSLIQAIAGVDFPITKLPADVGCIVDNVGTLYAIQRAVLYNEPLYSQVFTLTGEAAASPSNWIVRDGASFAELLEAAGGLKEGVELKKALVGGPMMGIALGSLDVPIQKQNNGLTLLAEDANELAEQQMTACLRCGRCATVCPVGLLPQPMSEAATKGDYERFEKKLYGLECIQCGSCTFACPAKRPLMQIFKEAKTEIMARKRAAAAGGKK